MTEPISLTPFKGVDNYHKATHPVFQPGEQPTALTACENFLLDDAGIPVVRSGLTSRTTPTAAQDLFSFNREGLLLIQDGATIVKVDPSDSYSESTLVSGLDDTDAIRFCEHAAQVFYTDGTDYGRIVSGAAINWGCSLGPTPSLSEVAGSLAAGRYHVALECIDGNGIRHAANKAATITPTTAKAIRVTVSGVDSNATHLRVYVAGPDDDVLYFLADVAVGAFPYDITTLPTEDTTCKSIGLDPPPTHNFAFSYQNHLMLVSGSVIYPSLSAAVHLYDLARHQVGRPEIILAGEGVAAPGSNPGFWTVSAKGAYWASGTVPEQWRQWDLKHQCEFCAGSAIINSASLPFLRLSAGTPVALFMSSWGLAVGLPDGQMLFPYRDSRTETVTGKRVSFAFVDDGDARLLIYLLR